MVQGLGRGRDAQAVEPRGAMELCWYFILVVGPPSGSQGWLVHAEASRCCPTHREVLPGLL